MYDLDPNKVCLLSDADLRKALEDRGEDVGPITSFTRSAIELRLIKLLVHKDGKDPNKITTIDFHETMEEEAEKEDASEFYGVYYPEELQTLENVDLKPVYTEKSQCLSTIKKFKTARFKFFPTYNEALDFSINGPPTLSAPINAGNGLSLEKPSQFRGPKSQDLVKFRKSIEKNDEEYFLKCIESNPRYLVSSGDTPAILQEGSRYNALHVACRTNRAKLCAKVLSIVSKVEFFQKLYPDDALETSQRRCAFLLDLYLNTPDKGLNETPLHFAVKYGSIDCVKALTSYSSCDKERANKFDQKPIEIICTRTSEKCEKVVEEIKELLGEQLIVPVLRDENNCFAPKVGQPCVYSPNLEDSFDSSNLSYGSLPGIVGPLMVRGFAGPMSPQKAEIFHRKWKTTSVPSPNRNQKGTKAALRITDHEKGLERVGREIANELGVNWSEYWDFLQDFANFDTEEGMQKLDKHLKKMFKEVSDQRNISDSFNFQDLIEIQEANDTVDSAQMTTNLSETSFGSGISGNSSIGDLCRQLEALRLNTSLSPMKESPQVINKNIRNKSMINDASKLEDSIISQLEYSFNTEISGISYIIQSCQVSSYRLNEHLCDFLHSSESSNSSNITLARIIRNKISTEIVNLKTVIAKVMTPDLKSENNFIFIHPLVAARSCQLLKETLLPDALAMLKQLLRNVEGCLDYVDDSSSEDEEETHFTKPIISKQEKLEASRHLQCVVKCIVNILDLSVGANARSFDQIKLDDIHNCTCEWESSTITNNQLNNNNNTQPKETSSVKYKKAHSFFNYVLFNEKEDIPNNSKMSSKSKNTPQPKDEVVKVLSYDEEDENVIQTLDNREKSQTPEPETKDNDDDDNDSFATAASSIEDGMMTPEEVSVFVNGATPNKDDMDVLAALNELFVEEGKYPYVSQWFHSVMSHSKETRNSWESPCCHKRKPKISDSAPGALGNKSNLTSTPVSFLRTARFNTNLGASPI